MAEPQWWCFSAIEAGDAAREVVHHAPETPWQRVPVPADADAAAESVAALAVEFGKLPPSIRGALGRATTNAAQLSDDQLQGLAELLQNADDVGADAAFFLVEDDRLLFGHNGSDLTLPDVWGLTIPWLSEKSDSADALGRFGIGLKTLQSLSEYLEAHNGHFHLSLGRSSLRATGTGPAWPGQPESATTVFVVPFQRRATTKEEVVKWLRGWGDAGLLFLRSLRSVTLLDSDGATVQRLHIAGGRADTLNLEGAETTRTEMSTDDGRTWLLYRRNAPSPASSRVGKAQAATTQVSIAFPKFADDEGFIHVGLPLRPVSLPFRFAGQFDPLANRRGIADSRWNLDVLELIAALWLDASLDLFSIEARMAWAAVPLIAEFDEDALTTGQLREALARSLMREARLAFADGVRLDGGDGVTHALADLAYETPDLTGILSNGDIRKLTGAAGVITRESRSDDSRWREVLSDLTELGAKTPAVVNAVSAVQLLRDLQKPIAFVADLTAAVIAVATADDNEDEDLEAELLASPCIVLTDGKRINPDQAADLQTLLPAEPSALWSQLGIGAEVHHEYTARSGWSGIASWLQSKSFLRRTASDEDALRVLAATGHGGIELPQPLTDEQVDALRSGLERVNESVRSEVGAGIGRAIRLEATVYGADGSRSRTFARPADAYFIEKERHTWSTAAQKTPGLVWLHRRYSDALRTQTARTGIGAQRLFRLLGAESAPRLVSLPNDERYYKHYVYHDSGLWRHAPGSPARRRQQMFEVGAECTLNDLACPDLDRVFSDIAKGESTPERQRRVRALLGCLARNWDRFEPHVKVTAATPDNGWIPRGEVDAWWVNRAASISWITNGLGQPSSPSEVRLKTPANEAMHGGHPALYLSDDYDQPAHREVLTSLGVEGNPTVPALIRRLEEIRAAHLAGRPVDPDTESAHPMTIQEAADLATPIYQALAAEVQSTGYQRRIGNMPASTVRAHFDRGDGLIITNLGWRRTSLARSGDPIFGELAAFVPAGKGVEPLWEALGVRSPDVDDAKRTLKQLARRNVLSTDERQIMLEALRLLAQASPNRLGQLRRLPVYVGGGWRSKRPVYAVSNPLLADAMAERVPVWQPGGQLTQLEPLIKPLALTSLDGSHTQVAHKSNA
ncbi:sacsin N-terminal ATP-binding-like domain-containing protein [Actinomadura welshii]